MSMLPRVLRKSFSNRKSRIAIAIVAVMMGASIASALLTMSMGVTEKIGTEFRKFGSNIMLIPESNTIEIGLPGVSFGSVTEQSYINETDLYKIKRIAKWSSNVLGYAPFLYQVVTVTTPSQPLEVVLAGTYFDRPVPEIRDFTGNPWTTGIRKIAPYWEVQGAWVEDMNDRKGCIVGVAAAAKLGLEVGSLFGASYLNPETRNETTLDLEVSGLVATGGVEDSQVFVNMEVAQELTARDNKVHSVQVSAHCVDCPAEDIAIEIEKVLPDIEAKSVRQLVKAEEQMMMSLQQMMMLIAAVGLGASVLGVMTTMTTTVIERRREIGLMKSIGAENSRIASLFLGEAALTGLAGGLVGYVVGFILAQSIGVSVFNTTMEFIPVVLPFTVGVSMGVAVLASLIPIRRALGIEPAAVLRGD